MPELPEVETVVRALAPDILKQRFTGVKVYDRSRIKGRFSPLLGLKIIAVQRLGKQIVISCGAASNRYYLAIHLRMSGRLLFEDGNQSSDIGYVHAQPVNEKHLRIEFLLNKGTLRFYDTRRFGTVELSRRIEDFTPAGVDPTSDEFDVETLKKLLEGSKQPLKNWLLRQDLLVGLGNIYACEILYAAKLDPFSPAGELDAPEVKKLHKQTKRILSAAIDRCGTTFSDFQDSRGSIGSYQKFLRVYGRENQACKRCKAVIERDVQAGRSTFFCPSCQ